ncbi:MAG: hypothetical protein NW201_12845 [Gemmatimonadales bacterium]|nr:hypothetical protein [Gemmatimonadales bacterium]
MTASAAPLALHTLLAAAIDYAGLFPPAALGMDAAVDAYARHRAGPDAWALGRFVLPVARLAEFAGVADTRRAHGWPLAVIGGDDPQADAATIRAVHAALAPIGAEVELLEARVATVADVAARRAAAAPVRQLVLEVPLDPDPSSLIDAVVAAGAWPKARTGGLVASAFPAPAQLARFLAACARAGTPHKVTAGLHHPCRGAYRLTYAPDAPTGVMFGFLNVMAAADALAHGGTEAEAVRLLELARPPVPAARGLLAGFGSCSFDEPLADLRTLGLLP